MRRDNPLISKAAGYGKDTPPFFVKDADHPYVQEKPFDWIRGYQIGGKSLIWGRACQRWSGHEFVAPEKLGYGMNADGTRVGPVFPTDAYHSPTHASEDVKLRVTPEDSSLTVKTRFARICLSRPTRWLGRQAACECNNLGQ
jgi:choline dehydrogenase-like flavoprotein